MFTKSFRRTFGVRMRRFLRGRRASGQPSSARAAARVATVPITDPPREYRARGASSQRLLEISKSAVKMASLGPQLANLGAELEHLAALQASQAAQLAITAAALAGDLDNAVQELRLNAAQVDESLATVSKMAESTKILSMNASIEAARAGVNGRAFSVVVDEVKRLSERSAEVTGLIEARMGDMRQSIFRVEKVAEHSGDEREERAVISVNRVNEGVQTVAESARSQLQGSRSLHGMSESMKALADQTLLAVGGFRFEIHRKAGEALEELLGYLRETGDSREALESVITGWLKVHGAFELAYLTDVNGIQKVDNLVSQGDDVETDPSGFGRDWSQRPWFRSAKTLPGVQCTDLYSSSATGDYCFTVSGVVVNREGTERGVVAADVNFRKLLEGC